MHSASKHAADLSRLLDPSYCSSTTKAYVSQAYVDPYGDLHDPDYRHFPTSFPSSSSSSSKRQNSPKPYWDLALDNNNASDDDSDELDEDDSFFLSTSTAARPQNHSRYSPTRRRIRPRESNFSIYNTTTNYYSPPTTISTLPTSYESDKTDLSRFSDADEGKSKKRRGSPKTEKEKDREGLWGGSVGAAATETYYRGSLEHSRDLPPTQEEEAGDARLASSVTSPMMREPEYVPTCSQSLRRQWQAFSLRFRFGVFRTQRNVMRRVHLFL